MERVDSAVSARRERIKKGEQPLSFFILAINPLAANVL